MERKMILSNLDRQVENILGFYQRTNTLITADCAFLGEIVNFFEKSLHTSLVDIAEKDKVFDSIKKTFLDPKKCESLDSLSDKFRKIRHELEDKQKPGHTHSLAKLIHRSCQDFINILEKQREFYRFLSDKLNLVDMVKLIQIIKEALLAWDGIQIRMELLANITGTKKPTENRTEIELKPGNAPLIDAQFLNDSLELFTQLVRVAGQICGEPPENIQKEFPRIVRLEVENTVYASLVVNENRSIILNGILNRIGEIDIRNAELVRHTLEGFFIENGQKPTPKPKATASKSKTGKTLAAKKHPLDSVCDLLAGLPEGSSIYGRFRKTETGKAQEAAGVQPAPTEIPKQSIQALKPEPKLEPKPEENKKEAERPKLELDEKKKNHLMFLTS